MKVGARDMSISTKDKKCAVEGCENQAVRSISLIQIGNYLNLKPQGKARRAYLCKEHYREYKKKSKKEKKTEKLRYGGGGGMRKSRGLKGPMS